MKIYNGINASEGIAIGSVCNYKKIELGTLSGQADDCNRERACYFKALNKTKVDLEHFKKNALRTMGEEEAQIFDAHLMILEDPEIDKGIIKKIDQGEYALNAIQSVMTEYASMFKNMEDSYMRERASDIEDIMRRLCAYVMDIKPTDLSTLPKGTVLIADDLMPSETAQLNKENVVAFVTQKGGKTSHVAIMARTLMLPAVLGISDIKVEDHYRIIVDGTAGKVIINPDEDTLNAYRLKLKEERRFNADIMTFANKKSLTKEGVQIDIASNIGSVKDIEDAVKVGAEGIGLFRTEFLFMDRQSAPTEEEQYLSYKAVLEAFKEHKVVIRTLDIGGDKHVPYMAFPEEDNPFLGFRAIRYCLDNPDFFKIQLRALLRASVHGNLAIMFPMICAIEEIKEAKALLLEARQELKAKGMLVNDNIEVGMMIEVPSSALMASDFAQEVDFFSIGTNDLVQYMTACDRMNSKLQNLYSPMQPAVLRMINHVVKAAKDKGVWIGMCGEAAGDSALVPLWLAMGFDELSMSSSSVLKVRYQLSRLSQQSLKAYVDTILKQVTIEGVRQCLIKLEH